MSVKLPDQNDILAENDRLVAQTREFRVLLITCGGETVEAPKLEGADIHARNEILRAHCEDVMAKIASHLLSSTPQARSIDHVEAIAEQNRALQTQLAAAKSTVAEHESTIKAMKEHYGDFETAVARKVAEMGINPKAISQPKAGAAIVPGLGDSTERADAAGRPGDKNYTAAVLQHQAEHGRTPVKRMPPK
jgi:hypothetical protein